MMAGMSEVKPDYRIDYVEMPAKDLGATKVFYSKVFGWKFEDYGPSYTSFFDGRLSGGFDADFEGAGRGVLLVIYAQRLEETEARIREAGGVIVKEIFSFPGGRRFHFADPSGNELAVWSE
jgi:uncharacterized protein